MKPRRPHPIPAWLLTLGLGLAPTAFAQQEAPALMMEEVPEEERLSEAEFTEEIVVTATRRPEAISNVPGAVTVVEGEQLQAQYKASGQNLADALGKLVPGLALGNQSPSTYGQTLRGRNVLVLIDGVPQSAVRNVSRDLNTLSPEAIERVEVVRGTTAIYGEGASGGIINIITRRPGTGQPRFSTTLEATTAAVKPLGGLGGRLAQTADGAVGPLGFSLTGALERTSAQYDAEGDRIPPNPYGQGGLAESLRYDLSGALTWTLTQEQRLKLTAAHFQGEQDTRFTTDPGVNELPIFGSKSRVLEGLEISQPEATRNTTLSLTYDHDAVLGSTVRGQLYYRNFKTNFFPSDGRTVATYRAITQSRLETQKGGGRLEIGTPILKDLNALWGLDAARERTAQPVTLMDAQRFDESGGLAFVPVGERDWVPPMDFGTVAAFGQLEWAASEWLTLRAGLRHERIWLSVDDYVTLIDNPVEGARLRFRSTVFNAGLVVKPLRTLSVYANFSQGYSLPDVGLILRNANRPGAAVATLNTAPQKVNMAEAGLRTDFEVVHGSLSAFINSSELGTSSGGLGVEPVRAPERVYGLEATLGARPLAGLTLDANFTWLEGILKREGEWGFLNGYRIPPSQLTLVAAHQTLPTWRNSVVLAVSGSRNRFKAKTAAGTAGFGELPVETYATVDLASSLEVGKGTATLAVSNLFNQQYYPRVSQMLYSLRNDSYAAARGAVVSMSYTLRY
ncbi:TonB-dependent receptor [Pyxidicoccus xibeiensis]|uniref:TonB-dependent receptor n=1 Tax=Pyxidicoccus xibeiensis TaxID=2906759 RepID=UPI0020A6DF94|nr:TonB-dependent receptor [Pyxidicoccus xibeiensis]MCP3143647.1 TonB-dependent receptor [Pyxidicoccus xibeiensis]